ncbi:TadE/TadG family type IV pilus assembly protein [Arhodomonas sp. AD133]|uniref:TadE/TadG family type IV pilus assembly protein n=1 Tax=Arhodomonas sp. AD133 TaxID=3415009 RepID=UPI003EBBF2FD
MRVRLANRGQRGRSQGATLAEMLYVMPLFFVLLFGILEVAYMYRTRATLNVATFQATRAGAMNHALRGPMRDALARGMMPLYMDADTGVTNYASAFATSRAMVTGLNALPDWVAVDPVVIVSPTKQIFDKFSVTRRVRLPDGPPDDRAVIPSDNLKWRSTDTRRVNVNGERQEINIQDANLLKVRTYWCHELLTPLLDRLIHSAVTIGPDSPEQRACDRLAAVSADDHDRYIAITSQSIVRMESDVFYDRHDRNLP